jgi:ER lumen protein retaining receptor
MKLFFILSSLYILFLMKRPFRPTFDPNIDTFKIEFLVIGAFAAAMVFNYEYSFSEVPAPAPASLSTPSSSFSFRP